MNNPEWSMKVSLKVSLDAVDRKIIDAMSTIRFLKVHEIRTIMQYNGVFIGYGELSHTRNLNSLCLLGCLTHSFHTIQTCILWYRKLYG